MMVPEIAGATNEAVQPAEAAGAVSTEPAELQRACVAVLRSNWRTLAVVATAPGAPAKRIANALVDVARSYRLRPVWAIHAAGAQPAQIAALVDELSKIREDTRVVVTLDDPLASPAAMPALVAADAAVLLVRLGTSEMRSVEATADLVGRDRILGCIVVR